MYDTTIYQFQIYEIEHINQNMNTSWPNCADEFPSMVIIQCSPFITPSLINL